MTADTGLVLFCHGARDASWREPFDEVLAQCRRLEPNRPCELAFLELMQPDLLSAIARLADAGCRTVRVTPIFLAAGSHTERDLPRLIGQAQQRWPDLRFDIARPLLLEPQMRAAVARWALGAG